MSRVSINAFLKSVIAVLAVLSMALFAGRAWDAGARLGVTARIQTVADASGQAFAAMNALRSDRSITARGLGDAGPLSADMSALLRQLREREVAAARAVLALLPGVEFTEKATLGPALSELVDRLAKLQAESWDALAKPKADRRETLARDYSAATTSLLKGLDQLSGHLFASIKHEDAALDQLMTIKQLAWAVRNAGGEASLTISNGMQAGRLGPEARVTYYGATGAAAVTWAALEDVAAGTALPQAMVDAMATAKAAFFGRDYVALRDRLFTALLAGDKPEMPLAQWSPFTIGKLNTMQGVADAALDAAKARAADDHAGALWALATQAGLLLAAALLAVGSLLMVSRRVVRPLQAIRDAMLQVAAGDLAVEAPFADRRDEIGALASALATFRQNAVEKVQIEGEQRERHAQAATRQQAVDASITAFEQQVGAALGALGGASAEMRKTSEDMSAVAIRTKAQIGAAAAGSEDASANVQTVAAASEELSASIAEISRQVAHAATIAARAVDETRTTDRTVHGLAETASRIGEVVKLINSIASQTNLLALNATIEAARAGEAGKGFAVVATEVKNLASQTARATDEIATQIAAVQGVAREAVDAIKRIAGTIGEVSSVASAIAAAVEEQGAATQEITRNTQAAARRTRDVSQSVVGVSAGAAQTGSAAEQVKAAAEALGVQSDQLRAQVSGFLAQIRTA